MEVSFLCSFAPFFQIEENGGNSYLKINVLERDTALKLAEKRFTPDREYNYLGNMALKNNIRIKSADLSHVVSVGRQAFYSCTAMREVKFEKLQEIQKEAFRGCNNLKEAVLPAALKRMGADAFSECRRLRRIEFQEPGVCAEIPDRAFSGCGLLEEANLPGSLKRIGSRAFYKCLSLSRINLPQGISSIGRETFYQCAFEKLTLPSNLEEIGESAFLKCKKLEYIAIPSTVEKIGKWAFHGCGNLKVLEIHHTPREMGEWITNKNCTIRCHKDSRMEEYAKKYGMQVEYLEINRKTGNITGNSLDIF